MSLIADSRGSKVEWLVVRNVANESLHVIFVPRGWRPGPARGFRWGGPYATCRQAYAAVGRDDPALLAQLYPQPPRAVEVHAQVAQDVEG